MKMCPEPLKLIMNVLFLLKRHERWY